MLLQETAVMRNTICANSTRVTLGEVTKTAIEWAEERGLKWQTVRMRRYRGASWEEALRPGLRRSLWMRAWSLEGRQDQRQTCRT